LVFGVVVLISERHFIVLSLDCPEARTRNDVDTGGSGSGSN
jgi:hypothetical protein